jgi:hypothetical protein
LGGFYGGAVLGPAAALTLIAGIVTAASAGFDMSALWIIWGFAGILASMALGATLIRRTMRRIGAMAETAAPGEARLLALQRRLAVLNGVNLLLLLSVVWAMIAKPVL